ncbi:MAG: hypothetical protein GY810_15910 [Aureispira sp.]|nr:hypothetical protein [Aureispira sp.]
MRYLSILIVAIFFTACSEPSTNNNTNTSGQDSTAKDSITTESTTAPESETKIIQGVLISGMAVESEYYFSIVVNNTDTLQFYHSEDEHGTIPVGAGKTLSSLIIDDGNDFVLNPDLKGRDVEVSFEIANKDSARAMVDLDEVRVIKTMLISDEE